MWTLVRPSSANVFFLLLKSFWLKIADTLFKYLLHLITVNLRKTITVGINEFFSLNKFIRAENYSYPFQRSGPLFQDILLKTFFHYIFIFFIFFMIYYWTNYFLLINLSRSKIAKTLFKGLLHLMRTYLSSTPFSHMSRGKSMIFSWELGEHKLVGW